MDSPPRLTLTTVRMSFSSQLTWLGKTVGVLVNRLSRYIAPNPIVANEEVFIPEQVLEERIIGDLSHLPGYANRPSPTSIWSQPQPMWVV